MHTLYLTAKRLHLPKPYFNGLVKCALKSFWSINMLFYLKISYLKYEVFQYSFCSGRMRLIGLIDGKMLYLN